MRKLYYCALGIIYKELLRFIKQKSRFFSALVRPLLWLFIFSVGFKSALGLAIIPPYETYITYETYIVPGLIGMILLFNGMQSSLAMIFDREMGSMKILLTSNISRSYLLFCKMFATGIVSTIQASVFLVIAFFYGIDIPTLGYFLAIPVILFTSIILNAFALFISSVIKQLENFASVMNFVIFPMFFLSSALYPLWKIKDSSLFLYQVCVLNPFTYIVEFVRFTLYLKFELNSFLIIIAIFIITLSLAFIGYNTKNVLKR
ncbi:ABC transporter permease [Poseidonibacter ostreae]|jgi:ABC-2 type transport system permease protein|uniref:Transport permease protein n=1 Tax=Poseidonibacter ostreae TaxID=2654171 RepID=A0A6L4WW35_9BACT|nr:ABC transporter permease [Poseidonibacter ostreae]KAB7888052.1 multidrug ABC transporter permease [Poseidonibacter ostreae]KAB7891029.1 multidrug ABC transporter permease [Poseidonibacter ostreae]KAB7892753.1 multidrug ABC transporter permease [Poseidonibacter ostreae]MAC84646.1 multidrug ABC transporter permease [Arcobacter sp.]|tara:strand:+ start:389 stop:1171 length:783 start_codon:yes stop_codon:yes gene_type:complete